MPDVFLALGANIRGRWGAPRSTLLEAITALAAANITTLTRSSIYSSKPLGDVRQPRYHNMVLRVFTSALPNQLIRLVKSVEKDAGRGYGGHWGPRPLDIDILDYQRKILSWPPRRRVPGRLVLPHPELHLRDFVLVPLLEIAPHWRHPVLGMPATTLLARLPQRGGIRRLTRVDAPRDVALSDGRRPEPSIGTLE